MEVLQAQAITSFRVEPRWASLVTSRDDYLERVPANPQKGDIRHDTDRRNCGSIQRILRRIAYLWNPAEGRRKVLPREAALKRAVYNGIGVMLLALPFRSFALQANLSEQCVQALTVVAKSSGPGLKTSGDRIYIGSTTVRLQARIENDENDGTRFFIGLRVDVFVNEVFQPLTYGSVGTGDDRRNAIDTAVSEWATAVGEALLGAVGIRIRKEPRQMSGFLVYEGPVGIRGSSTLTVSAEQQRQLNERISTFIAGMEHLPGALHSISLMLIVQVDGTIHGECRLDGNVSPELLKVMQSLSWGQKGTQYLVKQFYVLRRT